MLLQDVTIHLMRLTPIVTGIGENKRVGEKIGVEVSACDVDWGMVLEKSYDVLNIKFPIW